MIYPQDPALLHAMIMSMRDRITLNTGGVYSSVGILEVGISGWPPRIKCNGTLYTYPELDQVEELYVTRDAEVPPGSPRGAVIVPTVLDVLNLLKPELVILKEHGMCHPQRMGPATHVGILSGTPTIGISNELQGKVVDTNVEMEEIHIAMSDECALIAKDLDLNLVLASKSYPRVVGKVVGYYYISVGNMITLDRAEVVVRYIMAHHPIILEVH